MYKRVVLKLSGEFMGGPAGAVDAENFRSVCTSIERLSSIGVEVCVVVGGGNVWRGNQKGELGIEQGPADMAGMIATGFNATLLAAMLDSRGAVTPRLLTTGPVQSAGTPWQAHVAVHEMEAGHPVLIGGGWGQPFVTTDYPAVAYALEINAEAILMAKNGIDGVYDSDPHQNPLAKLLPRISPFEALQKNLRVMDAVALQLASENRIPIHVFSAADPELPALVAKGEEIGSIVW
jgi:uridylate kinase